MMTVKMSKVKDVVCRDHSCSKKARPWKDSRRMGSPSPTESSHGERTVSVREGEGSERVSATLVRVPS